MSLFPRRLLNSGLGLDEVLVRWKARVRSTAAFRHSTPDVDQEEGSQATSAKGIEAAVEFDAAVSEARRRLGGLDVLLAGLTAAQLNDAGEEARLGCVDTILTSHGAFESALYRLTESMVDDPEEDEEPELPTGPSISVLQRLDFYVNDESAVLAAGRKAESELGDCIQTKTTVGSALYSIAHHLESWEALQDTPGLVTGPTVVVVQRSQNIISPEATIEEHFQVEEPPLFISYF